MQIIFGLVLLHAATFSYERELSGISVIGPPIPHVFDQSGQAPFNLVFDALTSSYPGEIVVTFLPPKRAKRAFDEKEGQCVFIASDKTYDRISRKEELLQSRPITKSVIYFFSASQTTPPSHMTHTVGKRLAVENGTLTTLSSELPSVTTLETMVTEDPFQAFGLLERGRVDLVAAFIEDAVAYSSHNQQPMFRYDATFPLVEVKEGLLCWRSTETEVLMKHVDAELEQLRKTGQLQGMLGAMYRNPSRAEQPKLKEQQ